MCVRMCLMSSKPMLSCWTVVEVDAWRGGGAPWWSMEEGEWGEFGIVMIKLKNLYSPYSAGYLGPYILDVQIAYVYFFWFECLLSVTTASGYGYQLETNPYGSSPVPDSKNNQAFFL